jgi:hypothetical protein
MYNKAWARVLIVPAGAICLFLSGSANGAADGSSVDGWQKIAPSNGGFSVKMPGTPKEYTVLKYRQTRDRLVAVHQFTYEKDGERYNLDYADFDAPWRQPNLEFNVHDLTTTYEGTLLTESDITMNNHPGKQFAARCRVGELTAKIYSVGQRTYRVWFWTTNVQGLAHGVAYLKSFQLTQ